MASTNIGVTRAISKGFDVAYTVAKSNLIPESDAWPGITRESSGDE